MINEVYKHSDITYTTTKRLIMAHHTNQRKSEVQTIGSSGYYLRPVNPALMNDSISGVNNDMVKVYPNPSNGTFEVTTNNESTIDNIIVSDLTGRIVYSEKPVNSNISIDLSNLSTGTYYSVITTENNKVSYKKMVIIK